MTSLSLRARVGITAIIALFIVVGINLAYPAVPSDTLRQTSGVSVQTLDHMNASHYHIGSTEVTDVLAYPQQPASYIIWTDGSTYYAKNGTTGEIRYSNSNATVLIQWTMDNVENGGLIHFKRYSSSNSLYSVTKLTQSKALALTSEGRHVGLQFSGDPGYTIDGDFICSPFTNMQFYQDTASNDLFGWINGDSKIRLTDCYLRGEMGDSKVFVALDATGGPWIKMKGGTIENFWKLNNDDTGQHGLDGQNYQFFDVKFGAVRNMYFYPEINDIQICDCTIYGLSRIKLVGVQGAIFKANLFKSRYDANSIAFILNDDAGGQICKNNVIVGNTFNVSDPFKDIIQFWGNSIDNLVANNGALNSYSNTFATGSKLDQNKVENNIGYITENAGNATLTAVSSRIQVPHGCDYTPTLGDIQVTANRDLGNCTYFWMGNVTSTHFYIYVGASGAEKNIDKTVYFPWSVRRH